MRYQKLLLMKLFQAILFSKSMYYLHILISTAQPQKENVFKFRGWG